jgi:sulfur carrier protein
MRITINGDIHELADRATVRAMLDQLGFGERPVVVEVNKRALFPREIGNTDLSEGDVVEVVQITAGG